MMRCRATLLGFLFALLPFFDAAASDFCGIAEPAAGVTADATVVVAVRPAVLTGGSVTTGADVALGAAAEAVLVTSVVVVVGGGVTAPAVVKVSAAPPAVRRVKRERRRVYLDADRIAPQLFHERLPG